MLWSYAGPLNVCRSGTVVLDEVVKELTSSVTTDLGA